MWATHSSDAIAICQVADTVKQVARGAVPPRERHASRVCRAQSAAFARGRCGCGRYSPLCVLLAHAAVEDARVGAIEGTAGSGNSVTQAREARHSPSTVIPIRRSGRAHCRHRHDGQQNAEPHRGNVRG
jgi:hypothetical protein